ncbi:MAG: HTH domain-containing protein [Nanoarchaeota archaeon]|nr:HTH domain-containing protein [Nanoarchaeota archaeon]
MASKSKTREITIVENEGSFSTFFKKFYNEKKEFDFEGISALRKLLSNEKAKLLNIIKTKKPNSIYELAKILNRDLKAVKRDIKLLERFGFIDLIAEKSGERERLKPVIVVDSIYISVKL